MIKGDTVFYDARGSVIRATVKTVHRDGSMTVLALFHHRDGKDVPGYLGFKYRIHADDLRTAA